MENNYIITSDGSFISDEELYHYGIKGMKWGVRKDRQPGYKSTSIKAALAKRSKYRKGIIRQEVGKDSARKYLSEAKAVKKQLSADPSNKTLQKKYNQLMSKHDIERANARRATEVAANRSKKKRL